LDPGAHSNLSRRREKPESRGEEGEEAKEGKSGYAFRQNKPLGSGYHHERRSLADGNRTARHAGVGFKRRANVP